jgi:colicin import membrane protein
VYNVFSSMSDIPKYRPIDAQAFTAKPDTVAKVPGRLRRTVEGARKATSELGTVFTTVLVTGLALHEISKTALLKNEDAAAKAAAREAAKQAAREAQAEAARQRKAAEEAAKAAALAKEIAKQQATKRSTTKHHHKG